MESLITLQHMADDGRPLGGAQRCPCDVANDRVVPLDPATEHRPDAGNEMLLLRNAQSSQGLGDAAGICGWFHGITIKVVRCESPPGSCGGRRARSARPLGQQLRASTAEASWFGRGCVPEGALLPHASGRQHGPADTTDHACRLPCGQPTRTRKCRPRGRIHPCREGGA